MKFAIINGLTLVSTAVTSTAMAHSGHTEHLHSHAFEYGLFGLGVAVIAYYGLAVHRKTNNSRVKSRHIHPIKKP